MGLALAAVLMGTLVSMGASPVYPHATKRGWWIHVNASQTEASTILFQIGTSHKDRKPWGRWQPSQPTEFDVPADFLDAAELYIRGISEPKNKHAAFCVFYQDHGVKHFKFDGDEDHDMKQHDSDHECSH